jgi:hypothetical protein
MKNTEQIFRDGVVVEMSIFCRLAAFRPKNVSLNFLEQFSTLCYILIVKIKKVLDSGCNCSVTETVTVAKKSKFSYISVTLSYTQLQFQLQRKKLTINTLFNFVTETLKKVQVAEIF